MIFSGDLPKFESIYLENKSQGLMLLVFLQFSFFLPNILTMILVLVKKKKVYVTFNDEISITHMCIPL